MEWNHIFNLWRCIPLQPFGKLLWWKLMALMISSKEIVRKTELKYATSVVWYSIKTLHWKSSQYNWLENRNIEFIAVRKWVGLYFLRTKKNYKKFLAGEIMERKLENCCFSVKEQVDYRKVLYLKRIETLKAKNELPVLDRKTYSLNYVLSSNTVTNDEDTES